MCFVVLFIMPYRMKSSKDIALLTMTSTSQNGVGSGCVLLAQTVGETENISEMQNGTLIE